MIIWLTLIRSMQITGHGEPQSYPWRAVSCAELFIWKLLKKWSIKLNSLICAHVTALLSAREYGTIPHYYLPIMSWHLSGDTYFLEEGMSTVEKITKLPTGDAPTRPCVQTRQSDFSAMSPRSRVSLGRPAVTWLRNIGLLSVLHYMHLFVYVSFLLY